MNATVTESYILNQLVEQKHIPCATYRIQFNADFTFQDARRIVPYLHALGISDVYASPLLQARPGSTHGYDICDYGSLNTVLGTPEDFDALVATLREHDMGLLLDIVPNHMGVDMECNNWWKDVLENGPSSPYAPFFDIDWHPVKAELANKVLLPILEDQYGAVLESGKIGLRFVEGRFTADYSGISLPIAPDTYASMLSDVEQIVQGQVEEDNLHLLELQSILTALRNLPSFTNTDPEATAERSREKEIIKRRLGALAGDSSIVQHAIDQTLQTLNGDSASSSSYDRLDELLQQQPYRMAFWRVAADEINYRRFFDINDMAAIHIERPEVFEAVHQKVLELLGTGSVTGLRIDHPDGLWNPAAYFQALQQGYAAARLLHENAVSSEDVAQLVQDWFQQRAESGEQPQLLYVVAEKILSETEPLPTEWAVDGTTGYDFMTTVNGLFIETANESQFNEIYHQFIGRALDFREMIYNAKHLIMDQSLASEIRSLSRQLERLTEVSRRYRDFTLSGLTQAIREVIASSSIYRTYITEQGVVSERDQFYVLEAVLNARRRNPHVSRLLFTFIRDTLLLRNLDEFNPAYRKQVVDFVMKFQQITGPVMAKSVEDTAFYVYNRLVSLNEVGGHPEQFGMTLEQFHKYNQFRCEHWRHAMLSTSTHDTKRGEDVRARINVLSEMPDAWRDAVNHWAQLNRNKKSLVDDMNAPDTNDEYLYYQSLLGIWDDREPLDSLQERLKAYMTKATNEAKVHTSWINPDEAYNDALHHFIEQTLEDDAFLDAFLPLYQKVAHFGRLNALSQTLLKLTCPGVPDIYQGSELWNLSLVDPDNRRTVDFDLHRKLLDDFLQNEIMNMNDKEQALRDGSMKLMLTARTLRYRRDNPQLFAEGGYEPVLVEGKWQAHICAFMRRTPSQTMLTVVPLRCTALTNAQIEIPVGSDVWDDTRLLLPDDLGNVTFRDIFTGEDVTATRSMAMGSVFQKLPFALLISSQL